MLFVLPNGASTWAPGSLSCCRFAGACDWSDWKVSSWRRAVCVSISPDRWVLGLNCNLSPFRRSWQYNPREGVFGSSSRASEEGAAERVVVDSYSVQPPRLVSVHPLASRATEYTGIFNSLFTGLQVKLDCFTLSIIVCLPSVRGALPITAFYKFVYEIQVNCSEIKHVECLLLPLSLLFAYIQSFFLLLQRHHIDNDLPLWIGL